jgi:hypothetical protein
MVDLLPMYEQLKPGHVFVVRSAGFSGRMIRWGACLRDKPNLGNHVAGFHHWTDGVPWGIEGRPGGVGWVDMRRYFNSKLMMSNIYQPLTDPVSDALAHNMVQTIGTKYDWVGIAADGMDALGLPSLFASNWHGAGVPGHVVCSSLFAFLYRALHQPSPSLADGRRVKPSDWTSYIVNQDWLAA